MAFPTAVNSQITDAVQSPDGATGAQIAGIYQAVAHSTGLAMENALAAQQQMNIVSQAATVQGVTMMYAVDTAASAVAAGTIDAADHPTVVHAVSAVAEAARGTSEKHKTVPAAAAGGTPEVEAFARSLDELNAVNARQALSVIGNAATAAILARALRVDSAAPDARQQMAVWTGLLETVQRDLGGGAHSGG